MSQSEPEIDLDQPPVPFEEPAPAQAPAPAVELPKLRSPGEIMRDLRLNNPLSPVARLSPKVIISATLATALGLGAMVTYALRGRDAAPRQEQINTDNVSRTEAVNVLPSDYGKVPVLGPPLPGDFARPMLNGTAGAPPLAAGSAVPPQPPVDPRIQQALQEREAARTSQLFSGAESSRAQSDVASSLPGPAAPPADISNAPATGSTAQPSPASRRQSFLTAATDRRTTSPDRLSLPASTRTLQAGSVIAAALVTGIRSDIPGQVTAQVTQNVYDSVTGKTLLILQGSKLIGQYDAEIGFGQSRALLVWTRLILPDGRSLVLERLPAADPKGYAGLEDRVNYHWGSVAKAALLSTILSVGAELGSGSSDDIARAIRQGTQGTVNQAGQQIVSRQLDVPPSITIRPGTPVRVLVTRDLIIGDEGD